MADGRPVPYEPRVYDGPAIDVLYPGEHAISNDLEEIDGEVVVTSWLVEPAPGLRARLLRWRYRAFGPRP